MKIKGITPFSMFLSALVVGLSPAQATILTTCIEDVSCVFQGTVNVSTTVGHFTAGQARLALYVDGGSATVPPPNRIQTGLFSAASSDFWVSAKYNLAAANTTSNVNFIHIDDGATPRLFLRGTGTNQQVKLSKRNAAGTFTDLATATGSLCNINTVCKLDIHVVYAASGSVDVYSNGASILTYTGDVTTDSATTLNRVNLAALSTTSTHVVRWSEIIVADVDTRSMRSYTCVPASAGGTQSWTGVVGNVNPTSYNDASFNYTASNEAISQWTPNAATCTLPTDGTATVLDVISFGRLAIGTGGPQNARFSLDIGTTDYDNGSDLSGISTSFQNFRHSWGVNSPATSAPWTPAEINSGFSFGAISKP